MVERTRFQETHRAELAEHLPWPRIDLPFLFVESFDEQAIASLSDTIVTQLAIHLGQAA
jgi:hypothetical protein